MNVVVVIDVWMMLEYNVVLNGGKRTHFEYVWCFAHKVLIKCPNENYIDYWVSLGYGNDVNCSMIKCILN